MTDYFEYLYVLAVNFTEAVVVWRFICLFMGADLKRTRNRLILAAGALTDFIILGVMNFFPQYKTPAAIAYLLEYFLLSLVFFGGSVGRKALVSVIAIGVTFTVNFIAVDFASAAFDNNIDLLSDSPVGQVILSIFIQSLIFCIFDLILKFREAAPGNHEIKRILSVLSTAVFSLATMHSFALIPKNTDTSPLLLMISEFGIVTLIVICFYMTYNQSLSNKEAERLRMLAAQEEYRARYAENIMSQYEEIRRMRHDMKQNLSVITVLMNEKKYDEACDYAGRVSERLDKLEMTVDVGSGFINAILNSKLNIAKNKGIQVTCASAGRLDGVEDIDLCTMLGNMLDNAIAAAEKCSCGSIDISLRSDDQKIAAVVSNSLPAPVLRDNPALQSTKPDIGEHGYGIKTIRAIAEKYNGRAEFREEDNTFCSQALLYKNNSRS